MGHQSGGTTEVPERCLEDMLHEVHVSIVRMKEIARSYVVTGPGPRN